MNDEQRRVWARLTGEQRATYAEAFLTPEQREAFRLEARAYRRDTTLRALRAAGLLILAVAALVVVAYGLPIALPGLQW